MRFVLVTIWASAKLQCCWRSSTVRVNAVAVIWEAEGSTLPKSDVRIAPEQEETICWNGVISERCGKLWELMMPTNYTKEHYDYIPALLSTESHWIYVNYLSWNNINMSGLPFALPSNSGYNCTNNWKLHLLRHSKSFILTRLSVPSIDKFRFPLASSPHSTCCRVS